MRSATEYLTQHDRPSARPKAATARLLLRDQHGVEVASNAAQARPAPSVPPAVGRGAGASLVIISQQKQTVAENAQARAHLKLGFPMLSDPGGRIAQRFGLRWCIPEPRNVGIEPHYYSAVGNLQGADHAICIHNDMDVVPNLQDITDSVFRIPPSRTPAR